MAGLDDALVSYLTDKYADGEEEPNDATMKEMDDLPDRYYKLLRLPEPRL